MRLCNWVEKRVHAKEEEDLSIIKKKGERCTSSLMKN